jgi:hypothetical protein
MATKPNRIAPASIIADAASALLAQIESLPRLDDKQRSLACNAVVKAFNQLYEGINIARDGDLFIFPSRTRSGMSHSVNGVCDCEAGAEKQQPCWHRAAKRLVLMVEEYVAEQDGLPTSEQPPAPQQPNKSAILCPACGSAMAHTLTPGGEPAIECVNRKCGHTVPAVFLK